MTRDLAVRIADKLFASGESANGLISRTHHEEISCSKKRRKVVQKLLKHILYGSETVFGEFMDVLRKNGGDVFIAEELQHTPCSSTDLQGIVYCFSKVDHILTINSDRFLLT